MMLLLLLMLPFVATAIGDVDADVAVVAAVKIDRFQLKR